MKAATVGCGNWGKNIAKTLHSLGKLHSIVETSPTLLEKLSADYPDVAICSSLDQLLTSDVEAVCVATPVDTHFEVAKRLLEAEKHVFVEKPLVLDVAQGEALVNLAKQKKRTLMVGHLLLYQPALRFIKQSIDSGVIGEVFSFHQDRLNLGRARAVENVLWSLGVHDIAALLYLVGEKPLEVQGMGQAALQQNIEDDFYLHMKFPSGRQAHLHSSWLWPELKRGLTVVGSAGMLVYNEIDQTVTMVDKHIDKNLANVDKGSRVVFSGAAEPLRLEMEHFLECAEEGAEPLTSAESAVEVLRVLALASGAPAKAAGSEKEYYAHPTAFVDEGAKVGKGTKIWHNAHIYPRAEVGEKCVLGQNVLVANDAKVGNGVKIQNNVAVYEGVTLEDYVFCGPSMVFTNVKTPRSEFPRNTSADYIPTLVKRGASIGANATIVCGITLHECAFVAAGAVVTKDVPAYCMVRGNPARPCGWMSASGDILDFSKSDVVEDSRGHRYQRLSETEVKRLA